MRRDWWENDKESVLKLEMKIPTAAMNMCARHCGLTSSSLIVTATLQIIPVSQRHKLKLREVK